MKTNIFCVLKRTQIMVLHSILHEFFFKHIFLFKHKSESKVNSLDSETGTCSSKSKTPSFSLLHNLNHDIHETLMRVWFGRKKGDKVLRREFSSWELIQFTERALSIKGKTSAKDKIFNFVCILLSKLTLYLISYTFITLRNVPRVQCLKTTCVNNFLL